MSKPLSAFIIVIFLCVPSVTHADDCDAVLARDYYNQSTDAKTTLSLLSLVDEEHFDQFKQRFAGNVTVPLDGVPVDFGADWNTFKQARDRYISQLNIAYTDEEHQGIATSSVPASARKDWLDCKIRSTPGSLVLEIDSLSPDGSEIRITGEYSPQAGSHDDGKPDATNPYVLSNGVSFVQQPPASWGPNLQNTFSVKRDPRSDFFFTINLINGQANKLKLPAWNNTRLASQCKSTDSDGYCTRCEFEINNFVDKVVGSGPELNLCPHMKKGQHVQAKFESGFKVWFQSANQFWPEVGLQVLDGAKGVYNFVWNYPVPQSAQEFIVTIQTNGNDVVPEGGNVLTRLTPDKCVTNAGIPCALSAVPVGAHPGKPLLIVNAF